jgi:Cysteine-rich CPCC
MGLVARLGDFCECSSEPVLTDRYARVEAQYIQLRKMIYTSIFASRVNCPCCGYPTLDGRNAYEICELCNWEDDGQDDADAEEVRGGPNSNYSLAEARRNFKLHRVMYLPGCDQRIIGADSTLEYETKALLMTAFQKLREAKMPESLAVEAEIERLEKILYDETTRQVQEYEHRYKGGD